MNTPPPSTIGDNTLTAVDRLLANFDLGWKNGAQPQIEKVLQDAPQDMRADLFEGLLRVELAARLKQGNVLPVTEYLTRFADKAALVNSIYTELVSQHSTVKDHQEEWFYLRNGMPVGPFHFQQLQKLAQSGDLRPTDKVSRKGTVGWSEASTAPGLFAGPRGTGELKQPKVGQWVRDDYVLLEMIGRGGMGEIYKAFRFSLQKEVALKIIRFDRFHQLSPVYQRQALEGFQAEMQATARLRHEQIINILDTGDLNGLPFYTMDFGESSLARKLHLGPLPAAQAAEYIEKVSRAVDFAHQNGVIHRDIKPHNILLLGGKPVLADLGLAALLDKMFQGKAKDEVAGSPPYMAPEQVRGHKVDRLSDVYGLGATLYHLLTGQPPHQAADREQIYDQVLHADPVAPRKLNPTIDRDLEAITLKCLEKDPEKRYKTAALLADDLACFREGKPVSAKRPTPPQRVLKWARREPLKAGLSASVLFLLLVVFLLLSILYLNGAAKNSRLSTALAQTETERDRAKKDADDADEKAREAERRRQEIAQERKRANDLADLLGRRVLSKFRGNDSPNPIDAIDELKKTAQASEALLRNDPKNANIKLQLADSYYSLGSLYVRTNFPDGLDEAIKAYQRCITIQDELRGKYPELIVEIALNYLDLATIFNKKGNRREEFDADERALQILEEAHAKGYHNPPILAAMAEAHLVLGNDYVFIGLNKEKGIEHKKAAARVLEQLKDKGSVAFLPYETQLGKAYQAIGEEMIAQKPAEALVYFDKAKQIITGKPQFRKNLALVHLGQARALLALAKPDEALSALGEGAKQAEDLLAEHATLKGKQPQIDSIRAIGAYIASAQGRSHLAKGNLDEAKNAFDRSTSERKLLRQEAHNLPIVVDGCIDLVDYYQKQNDVANALASWDQAIDLQEQYVLAAPTDFTRRRPAGILYYNRGIFLANNKKFEEALSSLQSAKKHEEKAFEMSKDAAYLPYLYLTYREMFKVQFALRRYDEAAKTIINDRMRIAHWQRDGEKHFAAAEDLAQLYRADQGALMATLDFFDQALAMTLLDIERMRRTPVFDDLLANPQLRALIKKRESR